jgi:tetratricopeptide (TPR) repeat protein
VSWFDQIPPTLLSDVKELHFHFLEITHLEQPDVKDAITALTLGYLGLTRILHVALNQEFKRHNVGEYADLSQVPKELPRYFIAITALMDFYQMLRVKKLPKAAITGSEVHWWAEIQQDLAATYLAWGDERGAVETLEKAVRHLLGGREKLRDILELPVGDRSALAVVWARLGRIQKNADLLAQALQLELENSKEQFNEDRLKTLWTWVQEGFLESSGYKNTLSGKAAYLACMVQYPKVLTENKKKG